MPAIAKKGILYTETPSVENRVVEGNQNPVTSGAVYKEIGDTSVNNDLGANVSNQIENLHTQMQTKLTQVQTQIVPTASIEMGETASKAYSKGDFLVKNGVLYKVTNAIAEGDALTVGTNIDSTTVVDELNEIKPLDNDLGANVSNQVQSQIIPTASIEMGETASRAYSKGDFLVKDGTLYKVTKAIAKNDALTVGENIDSTTVVGELSEIKPSVQLSLDAVAVGKDEDGDTIYEKTFKGTTISSGTIVDSNLTISKLKWFHLVGGCVNENDKEIIPLPYDSTVSNAVYGFQVSSYSKGLAVDYYRITVKGYHFTIQYVLK